MDNKMKAAAIAMIIAVALCTSGYPDVQRQGAGQATQASQEQRFKQLDRNGDGKLTRDKLGKNG